MVQWEGVAVKVLHGDTVHVLGTDDVWGSASMGRKIVGDKARYRRQASFRSMLSIQTTPVCFGVHNYNYRITESDVL